MHEPNPTFSGFHQHVIYVIHSFIPAGYGYRRLKKKTTRKTAPVSNPPNVNHEQTWTKKKLFLKNYFYKVRKRKWDLTSFDINPKIKRLFRSPLSVSGLFAPLNARITHTNSFTFIYFCSTYERELCCVKTTRYSQRGPPVCRLFVSFFSVAWCHGEFHHERKNHIFPLLHISPLYETRHDKWCGGGP